MRNILSDVRRQVAIARGVYEALRGFREAMGGAVACRWEDTDPATRESMLACVVRALSGSSCEDLHDAWCEAKQRQGWVHGTSKDHAAKTHPYLGPLAEVPATERAALALIRSVTLAMAEAFEDADE